MSLVRRLRERVEDNARNAVDVYTHEVAEYRSMPVGADDQSGVFDFAVLIRRRTLDLIAAALPLHDDDLANITAIGRERAGLGLSVSSQRRVLGLHTMLMLREIHEAARPDDVDELLRAVGWMGQQGPRARTAYLRGYTDGVARPRAEVTRMELLARALLADEPAAPVIGDGSGASAVDRYRVSVLRIAGGPLPAGVRDGVAVALAARRVPVVWLEPDELVLLTPVSAGPAAATDLVREATAVAGRSAQVGSADGENGHLAGALVLAREVSRVAPVEDRPARLHGIADLFVEMSVAHMPLVDDWLRGLAQDLAAGPSLVHTLHAYYRNDMNRAATAAALNIHPRTLDYRLQRVRTVTGVDPGSTTGVRLLSTTVARVLAEGCA